MRQKIQWVIRCKYGQFIGPGKLVLDFEKARKYKLKGKAEEDCAILKEKLNMLPGDDHFFVEGWEED